MIAQQAAHLTFDIGRGCFAAVDTERRVTRDDDRAEFAHAREHCVAAGLG